MSDNIPRIRMFAGPNGSGKSTFKTMLRKELLGIYINPDEIENQIQERHFLDLEPYQVNANEEEILRYFKESVLLEKAGCLDDGQYLRFKDNKLIFRDVRSHTYFASVAADFIRKKLIENSKSFTFETVMSFPDKIQLLLDAQSQGYRTYLYYIATEDPSINIARVRYRVSLGGHSVPEDKIATRYYRSLDLLLSAIRATHRAYIFDNSTHEQIWLAEITNGHSIEMKTDIVPAWFKKAIWDKLPL